MRTLAGEEHVDIAVPPGTVWRYRLDFANLPAYNPHVSGLARVADGDGAGGPLGTGARYRFDLQTSEGPHPVELTVTEVVEPTTVAATMASAMSADEVFTVSPLDEATASHATLILWLHLPDGLDETTSAAMLASGRAQIRSELDLMRYNLELAATS